MPCPENQQLTAFLIPCCESQRRTRSALFNSPVRWICTLNSRACQRAREKCQPWTRIANHHIRSMGKDSEVSNPSLLASGLRWVKRKSPIDGRLLFDTSFAYLLRAKLWNWLHYLRRNDTRNKSSMLLSYLHTSPPVNERLAVGIPVLLPEQRQSEIHRELQRLEKVFAEAQARVKTWDVTENERATFFCNL